MPLYQNWLGTWTNKTKSSYTLSFNPKTNIKMELVGHIFVNCNKFAIENMKQSTYYPKTNL
jgi:hypothetical protein